MLQRLKRFSKLWKLSKEVDSIGTALTPEVLRSAAPGGGSITPEELREMLAVDLGDGKAEFLGEGTDEEFKQQQNEDKGYKGIFGL